jgi:hypothetical protein
VFPQPGDPVGQVAVVGAGVTAYLDVACDRYVRVVEEAQTVLGGELQAVACASLPVFREYLSHVLVRMAATGPVLQC